MLQIQLPPQYRAWTSPSCHGFPSIKSEVQKSRQDSLLLLHIHLQKVCCFWTFEAIRLVWTCLAQNADDKPQPRVPGARVEFKSPAGVTRPAESTRMAKEMGVEVSHLIWCG